MRDAGGSQRSRNGRADTAASRDQHARAFERAALAQNAADKTRAIELVAEYYAAFNRAYERWFPERLRWGA